MCGSYTSDRPDSKRGAPPLEADSPAGLEAEVPAGRDPAQDLLPLPARHGRAARSREGRGEPLDGAAKDRLGHAGERIGVDARGVGGKEPSELPVQGVALGPQAGDDLEQRGPIARDSWPRRRGESGFARSAGRRWSRRGETDGLAPRGTRGCRLAARPAADARRRPREPCAVRRATRSRRADALPAGATRGGRPAGGRSRSTPRRAPWPSRGAPRSGRTGLPLPARCPGFSWPRARRGGGRRRADRAAGRALRRTRGPGRPRARASRDGRGRPRAASRPPAPLPPLRGAGPSSPLRRRRPGGSMSRGAKAPPRRLAELPGGSGPPIDDSWTPPSGPFLAQPVP